MYSRYQLTTKPELTYQSDGIKSLKVSIKQFQIGGKCLRFRW